MKYFAAGLFLLLSSLAQAQPLQQGPITSHYTYRHFTTADGLPQIQITYLFCDSKGFVWVGTKFGLARWDGKQFKVFTPKEGAAGRQVLQVTELAEGGILVAWYSNAFNIIRGDVVETVTVPAHWNATTITALEPAAEKEKIFVCVNGFSDHKYLKQAVVAVYNIRTKRFEREVWLPYWLVTNISPDGYFMSVDYRVTGAVGPRFYLYKFNQLVHTGKMPEPELQVNHSVEQRNSFLSGQDYSTRYIPVLTGGSVSFRSHQTGLPSSLTIRGAQRAFFVNDSNCVYQNSHNELIELVNGQSSMLAKLPLTNFKIYDKENNLWVATENGLYCFYRRAMRGYQIQQGPPDEIWSMAKNNDGTYYYSSYAYGFWKSTDNNQNFQRVKIVDQTAASEFMRRGSYGTIALKNGGVILAASGGFYYLGKQDQRQFNLYGKGADMFAAWEDTIHQKVLISKHTWLFELDLKTLKLDTILKLPHKGLNTVLHITADRQNRPILSGAGTPLIRINNQWTPVTNKAGLRAISSCVDAWNGLWLGHAQQLTFVKDDSVYVMKQFPGRQLVLSLTTWNQKWLVIGGGFEIIFLDLETFYKTGKEMYQRYDAGSGFLTTEGGQNSFVHDSDGSIWWPCQDKLIRFWPQQLLSSRKNLNSPQLFSTIVANQNDSSIILTDTSVKGLFKTSASFRNLQFRFGAAAMNNYENLVYRYKLSGLTKQWSQPSPEGFAVFNNLPPGNYQLELQSSFNGSEWSAVTTSLPVHLPAYWYETRIARIAGILATVGLISLLTWWIAKRKRAGIERQKQIHELQLKAIRSKAIPHFSGNAFANIDYYIEKGDTENASKYLAILSRLYNITLADSDLPARTLDEELNYVQLYLQMEQLRFEERVQYRIEVDPAVDKQILVPNMILHTYAENAIKHGLKNKKGPGMIVIRVNKQAERIYIDVEDNGIGRDAAKLFHPDSTKQGLAILHQQIELYNQQNKYQITQTITDLTDADGIACGTRFSVSIPVHYTYGI